MTLVDYANSNDFARVKTMYILLAPRDRFRGGGGLEALGIHTELSYAAANAYGRGTGGGNSGVCVAKVDANVLPDSIIGRENQKHYPSIFSSGTKSFGRYLDSAKRERFGVLPENPPTPWTDEKIRRFALLNEHFGEQYEERIKLLQDREQAIHNQAFGERSGSSEIAYVILMLNPSKQFAPFTTDIAAVFYGETDSYDTAIRRAREFRIENPTAPRMVVAPILINDTPEQFASDLQTLRNAPNIMPYYEPAGPSVQTDVREYESMLDEVAALRPSAFSIH